MTITLIVLGILIAGFVFLIFRAKKQMAQIREVKDSDKVKILNDQNFAAKTKAGTVLVDFWADWCMPCKLMVPVLNDVAEEAGEKVMVAKLDIDKSKATAAKFKVRSIPTMILFRNGKEVHRFVGVKTKDYLLREIDRRITLN